MDGSGKGIFPPSTACHGPPSQKRRDACRKRMAYKKADLFWSADLDAELMEGAANGFSFTQIAKRMGLSISQVSSRFKRLRDAMGEQAK